LIEITKELDVEVTKPNIFQAIVAKQYDMNTRFLKVTLKDCGNRIDVPLTDTTKVVINAERKDGQSKGFDGVINDDGTVTVPLHSWMLELDGTVICDISVIDTAADDNKKLTTTSFTLLVEKAAFGGNDITSDPQFDVLVALLEAAETADEALGKSKEALKLVADCEEATENANAVREEIEAGGYIESLKEINNGSKFSVWIGTSEEYEALTEKVNNCLYITTDGTTVDELKGNDEEIKTKLDALAQKDNEISGRVDVLETDYVAKRTRLYRKWNSGVAECWGQSKIVTDLQFGWGPGYTEPNDSMELPKQYPITIMLQPENDNTVYFTKVISYHIDVEAPGHLIFVTNAQCSIGDYGIPVITVSLWSPKIVPDDTEIKVYYNVIGECK